MSIDHCVLLSAMAYLRYGPICHIRGLKIRGLHTDWNTKQSNNNKNLSAGLTYTLLYIVL